MQRLVLQLTLYVYFRDDFSGSLPVFFVLKKISKIILTRLFFAIKHLLLTWKCSEIFDKNFVEIFVNAKTSAAGAGFFKNFLKNSYLYAENGHKMINFWFKKCLILELFC